MAASMAASSAMNRLLTPTFFAAFIGVLPLVSSRAVLAQETNAHILRQLAGDCVGPVAEPFRTVVLRSDPVSGFLTPGVVAALTGPGRAVYVDPAAPADSLPGRPVDATISFLVDGVTIRYDRSGRRHVARTVELHLAYIATDASARVLADSTCAMSAQDVISRSSLDSIENPDIPLTTGRRPQRSWLRRYVEPAVVASATAVAVYLFFNVRSDTNSDSP